MTAWVLQSLPDSAECRAHTHTLEAAVYVYSRGRVNILRTCWSCSLATEKPMKIHHERSPRFMSENALVINHARTRFSSLRSFETPFLQWPMKKVRKPLWLSKILGPHQSADLLSNFAQSNKSSTPCHVIWSARGSKSGLGLGVSVCRTSGVHVFVVAC